MAPNLYIIVRSAKSQCSIPDLVKFRFCQNRSGSLWFYQSYRRALYKCATNIIGYRWPIIEDIKMVSPPIIIYIKNKKFITKLIVINYEATWESNSYNIYDGTKKGWFIYTSRTLKGRWHMVVKCFIWLYYKAFEVPSFQCPFYIFLFSTMKITLLMWDREAFSFLSCLLFMLCYVSYYNRWN